jgi:hypothetical protein
MHRSSVLQLSLPPWHFAIRCFDLAGPSELSWIFEEAPGELDRRRPKSGEGKWTNDLASQLGRSKEPGFWAGRGKASFDTHGQRLLLPLHYLLVARILESSRVHPMDERQPCMLATTAVLASGSRIFWQDG